MKIYPEHFNIIKNNIHNYPGFNPENYKTHKENNLSDTRFIWDMLWKSTKPFWIVDNIYSYANDEHINTVLNRILREFKKEHRID